MTGQTYAFAPGEIGQVPGHPAVEVLLSDPSGTVRVIDADTSESRTAYVTGGDLDAWGDIIGTGLQIRVTSPPHEPLTFELRVRPICPDCAG